MAVILEPYPEPTMLAWVCGCAVDDVHAAARALRLAFAHGFLMSMPNLRRLARRLGTDLELRRALGTAPGGRCLAVVSFRRAGEESLDLWGLHAGDAVVQWCNESEESGGWASGRGDLGCFLSDYRVVGFDVRITTWLVPIEGRHAW